MPVVPAWRDVAIPSLINVSAPLADPAAPPRSRAVAITGADSGVDNTAASAFNPRTSTDLP
jgi:hypothetical protein